MNRFRWYGPSIVLILTIIVAMLAGPQVVRKIVWAKTDAEIVRVKQSLEANPSLAELSHAFRKVAEVVEPSVVHIQIMQKPGSRQQGRFHQNLPFPFDRLPKEFLPPENQQDEKQSDENEFKQFDNRPRQVGNGSGWVYDNKGHIITNTHVVENADEIVVKFANGSEYDATVVGTDPKSDVAVIKIDNGDLHPAAITKESVQQGDIVFAFGSPFGEEFSMSQGIVSGVGRSIGILNRYGGYENFIQTDAAINPGNSGGPLTNIYGEVIGMNIAIRTNVGTFSGVGYAIPVKQAIRIADQIIEKGKVQRGFLGVTMAIDPDLTTFGYDGDGVLVDDTLENFPADKAGIKAGDIITRIDDIDIKDAEQLRQLVASFLPGDEIKIRIFREGEYQTLTVKLVELTDDILARDADLPDEMRQMQPEIAEAIKPLQNLGIEQVQQFTEQLADDAEMEFTPGVIINKVRPGSVAYEEGLRNGNVIIAVFDEKVSNVEQLGKAVEKLDLEKSIRLRVYDGKRTRFVFLKLETD